MNRALTVLVLLMAIASLVVGGIFIFMGFAKQGEVKAGLAVEKVAYNFTEDKTAKPTPVENMTDLENMAKTLKSHRDKIAPSYGELTARNETKKFDPTNPSNLSYAQGMNLENSVRIALLSFGLTWVMIGAGAFMVMMGFALLFISLVLMKVSRQ